MHTITKMFNFIKEMQKKIREIVIKISKNTAFFSYEADKIDNLITCSASEGMGNDISFARNLMIAAFW